MKNILIPTDFSVPSRNAAMYGLNLAASLKVPVTFIHGFHVPLSTATTIITGDLESKMETEEEIALREFAASTLEGLGPAIRAAIPNVSRVVREGFAVDVILEVAREVKDALVVMGTHGSSGIEEVFLGSITSNLIQKTEVPVLAVPSNCEFRPFKKIAYATDWNEESDSSILTLLEMIKPLSAKLELVHVIDGGETMDFLDKENLERAFPLLVSHPDVSFQIVKANDIIHGLQTYASEHQPDTLAMTTHHRSFLKRIFTRSLTEKMAMHTRVPLLALHA